MEIFNPEKARPKTYLPEVKAIIDSDPTGFLRRGEKLLASMSEKKDTLRHSQRMTNLGYLLAKKKNFSDEEIKYFVEACFLHDIGKTELPKRHLNPPKKFEPKDLKVVKEHAIKGHGYLKQEGRSPRVYNAVLVHHEFQEDPYPDTKAAVLRRMEDMEDVDVDNGRLLAMIDVFDTRVFGRAYSKLSPLSPKEAKDKLNFQFDQPGDAEIIEFLFDQYETIKSLS